jgi:hypothetical protein
VNLRDGGAAGGFSIAERVRVERQPRGRHRSGRARTSLPDVWCGRKSFAYGGPPVCRRLAGADERALRDVSLSFQNLDSVELGATDI